MRWLVVIGAALMLAPSATAALPNPCTLLTNADVAKVLGSKVESKQTRNFGGSTDSCQWTGVNLAGPNSYAIHRTLTVTIDAVSRSQFRKFANDAQGSARIKGVGQIAYVQGNGNLTQLEIWQSGRTIGVIANLVANPLAAEKAAAKLVVARL